MSARISGDVRCWAPVTPAKLSAGAELKERMTADPLLPCGRDPQSDYHSVLGDLDTVQHENQ
ncbi:MAG: hypothetical protein M1305_03310 [Candidatus Marsarchaeota archaeon]|nr:hypothetical protein [Candidatus Marsarchaeota archaeon]